MKENKEKSILLLKSIIKVFWLKNGTEAVTNVSISNHSLQKVQSPAWKKRSHLKSQFPPETLLKKNFSPTVFI